MTDEPTEPPADYLASTAAVFNVSPAPTTLLPASAPRRGRSLLVALAAVLGLVLTAGTFTAVRLLSGGSADPATAVPASAFAFAAVDLDPSASQKLGIYRFSRRFPDSPTATKGDSDSVMDTLLASIVDSAGSDLSYDKDIKPWLGGTAAFAAYTGSSGKTEPMAVLGYTDRGKAERALKKSLTSGDGGYAFLDEYVVLAPTQAGADAAAAAAKASSLADANSDYAHDIDSLRGDPVITAWADLGKAFPALQGQLSGLLRGFGGLAGAPLTPTPSATIDPKLQPKGRVAVGISVDDDVAQLEVKAFGNSTASTRLSGSRDAARYLNQLPKGTTVAVAAGDLRPGVKAFFDNIGDSPFGAGLSDAIASAKRESGLSLPDDLTTLLGDAVAVAYDRKHDQFAVRTHPSNVDAAKAVLDKLTSVAATDGAPIEVRTSGRDVIVANDADYLDRVTQGGLTGSTLFGKAVGKVPASPQLVAFVDLETGLAGFSGTAEHFSAVGMVIDGSADSPTLLLRLIVR